MLKIILQTARLRNCAHTNSASTAIGCLVLNRYERVRSLNIRGISDLLDDKVQADHQNYQPLAAAHAASFAFELLEHLDLSE